MAASGGFWWCVKHGRVEAEGDTLCPAQDRLGPYPSAAEAGRALDTVAARNQEWDAEDERRR